MPHLRLEVPEAWLRDEFAQATGVDVRQLMDHLVEVLTSIRMENAAIETRRKEIRAALGNPDAVINDEDACRDSNGNPIVPVTVPLVTRKNLKHAIVPVYHWGVGGDRSKGFLHLTFSAGNDMPGRTAAVRRNAAEVLGDEIDKFVGDLPNLESVTVHVKDIDRDRGYSTTAERRKKRQAQT